LACGRFPRALSSASGGRKCPSIVSLEAPSHTLPDGVARVDGNKMVYCR